jgi:hypothetical protein
MRRREFIMFVDSATVFWPLAPRAQQGCSVKRISVLMPKSEGGSSP